MTASTSAVPKAFIWRRLHSLMGLWLVLFLMEHLLTNSQAALWLGDSGQGFVHMVNALHNLPYLHVIEIILLGVPILIHLVWGVKYALTGKSNSNSSDGSKPSLPEYGRNRAYSWQRITSWILLIGLIGHVVKFRFLEYPDKVNEGDKSFYFVRVSLDDGLYTLSDRLHVQLYDQQAIQKEKDSLEEREGKKIALLETADLILQNEDPRAIAVYDEQKALLLNAAQQLQQKIFRVEALTKKKLATGEVIAVSDQFGTAMLLSVRDVFKSPTYVILYTVFVLAACFHAFNGLWTFLITWGWVLRQRAQKSAVTFCIALMAIVAFLGLAAIWGTYWINLRY
jgi:succinate dehydrogenase / fumarate reductase cytochrome b subunit